MGFRLRKAKRYSKRLEMYSRSIIVLQYQIKRLQKQLDVMLEKRKIMEESKERLIHLAESEIKQKGDYHEEV